jgi:hypothetical protein
LNQSVLDDRAEIIARQVDGIEGDAGLAVLMPDVHLLVVTNPGGIELIPDPDLL